MESTIIKDALNRIPEAKKRQIQLQMQIAVRVSNRMHELEMSLNKAARLTGMYFEDIADIVNGDKNLDIQTIAVLESVLKIKLINVIK